MTNYKSMFDRSICLLSGALLGKLQRKQNVQNNRTEFSYRGRNGKQSRVRLALDRTVKS